MNTYIGRVAHNIIHFSIKQCDRKGICVHNIPRNIEKASIRSNLREARKAFLISIRINFNAMNKCFQFFF